MYPNFEFYLADEGQEIMPDFRISKARELGGTAIKI